jgi:hypothetical protein
MEVEDFTYEHQIINQANYLMSNISDSRINGVILTPTTIFSIKIFAFINKTQLKNIKELKTFLELSRFIDNYINSSLNEKYLNDYIDLLIKEINKIISDGPEIRDIKNELKFIILLNYVNKYEYYISSIKPLIEVALKRLDALGNNDDFMCLLKLCNNDYKKDTFPLQPSDNIQVESLIELQLNDIINSNNVDNEFYKKLKTRRLLFIKKVYDKINIFKDKESLFKPSSNIINDIFIAAIVLTLLNYNNIITLNKVESEEYLDKLINENMVEKEIRKRVEELRQDLITFTNPLQKYIDIFKTNLFVVVVYYTAIWAIFSLSLYFRVIAGIIVSLPFLVSSIMYLLYESYKKTRPKHTKIH